MQISFSPQRSDAELVVSRAGDVLTINGEAFDFSGLAEGETIPAGDVPSPWFAGPVDRIGGQLHLVLMLPHGPSPSAAVAYPQPITAPSHGTVTLPAEA